MNWVDLAVIAIVAVSALLAFVRGFVREVLGVGAWIGAAIVAWWAYPYVLPRFHAWIGNSDLEAPAAFIAVFLGALILFSVMAGMTGSLVRMSLLAGLDRILGLAFGLVRGAAIVVVAYIGLGLVVPPDRWPAPLQQAQTLPYAYRGAAWVADRLPAEYRPKVPPPPNEVPGEMPGEVPGSVPEAAPASHAEELLPPLRTGHDGPPP